MIFVVLPKKLDPAFQLLLDLIWNDPGGLKLHGKKKYIATFFDYNDSVASFASNVE